jgi:hypothetical protein
MSSYDEYGDGAIKRLENEYSREVIEREIGYMDRTEAMVRKYRAALLQRAMVIEKTAFVWQVVLQKRRPSYGAGKVEYQVTSKQVPQVPDGERHAVYTHGEGKRWEGQEHRAEAVTMAAELAAKHSCKVTLDGFKQTKEESRILITWLPEYEVVQV